MESEQTKRLQMEANLATPKNESEFHACYIEEWVELSRRLDALESAERERQPTPAPAAAETKDTTADRGTLHDGMARSHLKLAMEELVSAGRYAEAATVRDALHGLIPLSPPANAEPPKPAPPPADVVRREVDHPDIEMMAEKVHLAYLNTCHRLGWPPRDTCNVPYIELPADAKELDRASVRAVLSCFPFPSSPAPDVRAEAEMEMWKRCREAAVLAVWGSGVQDRIITAIDALKPTAPAGTGGEGGGK